MPLPKELHKPVQELVAALAQRDYARLVRDGRAGRLTELELENAVRDYGRTVFELPPGAVDQVLVTPIEGSADRWAVDIDLWSVEEGRSDLTLQITAWLDDGVPHVEIEDIHVL